MISRRGFAKLIGMSSVAAPVAAKSAADAEIGRLVGITETGAPAFQHAAYYGPPASGQTGNYDGSQIAAADYAKLMGVPEFVRESMRRQSLYVSCLDPDLAAKRSWSMSIKILTQRERNLERQIEAIQYGAWYQRGASVFQQLTGWRWPW